MTSRSSTVAAILVRAWTRIYTWGMDAERRHSRQAEIESDLWESEHDEVGAATRWPSSLQTAARLVAGVPADVLWRLEYSCQWESPMRRRIAAAFIAVLGLFAAYALMLSSSLELPELPEAPRYGLTSEGHKGPPPPPPPSPTWDQFVRKVTTYGAGSSPGVPAPRR
jgi:hypothetical protein